MRFVFILQELKRNFKKYQKMFEAEDVMKDTEASKVIVQKSCVGDWSSSSLADYNNHQYQHHSYHDQSQSVNQSMLSFMYVFWVT